MRKDAFNILVDDLPCPDDAHATRELDMTSAHHFIQKFGTPPEGGRIGGVAVAPVIVDQRPDGYIGYTVLFGRERWGQYSGQWNFFGGGLKARWETEVTMHSRILLALETARAELWEEMGVRLSFAEIIKHTMSVVYLHARGASYSLLLLIRCAPSPLLQPRFMNMVAQRDKAQDEICPEFREHVSMTIRPLAVRFPRSAIKARPVPMHSSEYITRAWAFLVRALPTHSFPPPVSFESQVI